MYKLLLYLALAAGANACYRADDFLWAGNGFNWYEVGDSTKVIWGNNEFVLTNAERVNISSDGKTWTEPPGQNRGVRNIAWGNGQYISVGFDILSTGNDQIRAGGISTSTDLVNWTPVLEIVPDQLNDVVWGGAGFLAVGDNGLTMKSADGTYWIQIDSGINEDLDFVKWVGDKYFIKGHTEIDRSYIPSLYYSHDGDNFTKINLDDNPTEIYTDYRDLTFGKSKYILSSSPVNYISDDGVIWSSIMQEVTMGNVTLCDSSLQFVGVRGGGGWFDAPRIYTSTDGQTWYEHWVANMGGDLQKNFYPESIACHDDSYVIGGRCSTLATKTDQSCILYSP